MLRRYSSATRRDQESAPARHATWLTPAVRVQPLAQPLRTSPAPHPARDRLRPAFRSAMVLAYFLPNLPANFSRKICRARKTRDRTAASLMPSVAATSVGDISSIVDRINGSRNFSGRARDHSLQHCAHLDAMHRLIRRGLGGSYFGQRSLGIFQRNFPRMAAPSAPIYGDAPCDSRQPRLRLIHTRQLRTVAQHPHERFLRGILGIVMAAQHGIGNSVDQA